MQGHCVSGTIHLGAQGSQKIRMGTHRFGTSHHPTKKILGQNFINQTFNFQGVQGLSKNYVKSHIPCVSDMNGDSALHWAAYKGFPGLMQVINYFLNHKTWYSKYFREISFISQKCF